MKHCPRIYWNKFLPRRYSSHFTAVISAAIFLLCWTFNACGCGIINASSPISLDSLVSSSAAAIKVNSVLDTDPATLPSGTVTLRSAMAKLAPGGTITFDPGLDGKTIELTIIGEAHAKLPGEFYAGAPPVFQGYVERDYGASALYVKKDITLDASQLPNAVTLKWAGEASAHARVLAVYGNLTLKHVNISSGYACAQSLKDDVQPWTLGRGGGLAVWGTATLKNCAIYANRAEGDLESSRDRGTYGGGIYANGLIMNNCIISGNSAIGYGAAGGGIYSVGGAANLNGIGNNTRLDCCTISGNRVTAQHAYGGGIFSLSGGPANQALMQLSNCTVARNLVTDHTGLPEAGQYYYRGGGIYLGGGSLSLASCTVAENQVNGNLAIFSGKPNMGGGGIAATIGNAHVIGSMEIWHSLIVGNRLNGAASDVFTGSLLEFFSYGYNLMGNLDFSQILVPIPEWWYLSRKHWPKTGDADGVDLSRALSLDAVCYHPYILSAGSDAGAPAVLYYAPGTDAREQIPASTYNVDRIVAQYQVLPEQTDDFLTLVLQKLRTEYAAILPGDFASDFPDFTGVTWHGPSSTWTSNPENNAWIKFWRDLDSELGDSFGSVKLGDDFWSTFSSGPWGDHLSVEIAVRHSSIKLLPSDQLGHSRPSSLKGDIGAIEN